MTNPNSMLKSRDTTLLTKVYPVKVMAFPVVIYTCECWAIKKPECWRIDDFELSCWRRLYTWTSPDGQHQDQIDYILCSQRFGSSISSVAQSCLTLCNPMNRSTPGLPVHHQLPELTQTHVHWVRDAIQPSHPGSSPSPPALNPSQHQSLFQWVNSSHQVAKVLGVSALASVLPKNTQDWSPLEWTGWISLHSKGLSRVFSNTTVQMHQFFNAQPSSQSKYHIHTWPLENP